MSEHLSPPPDGAEVNHPNHPVYEGANPDSSRPQLMPGELQSHTPNHGDQVAAARSAVDRAYSGRIPRISTSNIETGARDMSDKITAGADAMGDSVAAGADEMAARLNEALYN